MNNKMLTQEEVNDEISERYLKLLERSHAAALKRIQVLEGGIEKFVAAGYDANALLLARANAGIILGAPEGSGK